MLPRSLVAAFVKTDKDLQAAGKSGISLFTLLMSSFQLTRDEVKMYEPFIVILVG